LQRPNKVCHQYNIYFTFYNNIFNFIDNEVATSQQDMLSIYNY